MKTVFGILLFSGYVQVPYRRMYWESGRDCFNSLVSAAMPRSKFEEVLKYLHLNNNDHYTADQKDYKVASLLKMLNERFKTYNFSEQLSIDESMCKYFGKHSAKQFMRQKLQILGIGGFFWVFIPHGLAHRERSKCWKWNASWITGCWRTFGACANK